MPVVSSLFVYPIKSCQGLSMTELRCDARGPLLDRRFMLVDDSGRFITQRENPRLSLVAPRFDASALTVTAPHNETLRLPEQSFTKRSVSVWSYQGEADDLGDDCAAWFSRVIEQSCRIVRFPDGATRKVAKSHTTRDAEVAFADGYPLLLLSLESLSELNRRLEVPLPMNRFRPNIVVRDCQPFQEDEWRTVSFGELVIDVVKACTRCKITTLNPETLEYSREPLATLAKFRRTSSGVIFGQNAIHHGPGIVHVGDKVEVLSP